MKNTNSIASLRLLTLLGVIVMLLGCSCITKPKDGTLTGSIELLNDSGDPGNDPADFSGVVVALYHSVEIDSALVSAQQKYPNVGTAIGQNSEFDHREHTPAKSATTNAVGSISIPGIEPGFYNIVISKPGWGWKYLLDCKIEKGDNVLADFLDTNKDGTSANLYPEIQLSGTMNLDLLLADHTYVLQSDATIVSALQIQRGALLLIKPGMNLTCTSGLTSVDTGAAVSSKISVFAAELNAESYFGKVLVYGATDLRNISVYHSTNGLQFMSGTVALEDIRIRNCTAGLTFNSCPQVSVKRATVTDIGLLVTSGSNTYTTQGGVDVAGTPVALIEKSVFLRCNAGVKIRQQSVAEIRNNFFGYNTIGAEAASNPATVHHNQFQGNYSYGMRIYGPYTPNIYRNNFFGPRGVNIGLDTHPANMDCVPTINYNNFSCTVFAIRVMGYNSINVAAANNYYYTTNPETIAQLIWDKTDYDPLDWSNMVIPNTAYVLYTPYQALRITDAGIQSTA